jgi:TonB-dependent receptor
VRYVETTNESTGGVIFPDLGEEYFYELIDDPANPGNLIRSPLPRAYANLGCYPQTSLPGQPPVSVPNTIGCYISESDYNYMDGTNALTTSTADHKNWLPSLNVKFDLNDDWVLRFAGSKAMSRPDIGNMKNFVRIGKTLPEADNANDPLWIKDSSGTITGANVIYRGDAQNPYLKPVIATQFDVTLEYYFGDPGSLTFALFQKSFDDYIQFGVYDRAETNNGETMVSQIRGPLNGEGAKITGFEIAFQRFFDFLPAPFDGIGVQSNYTHINNQGITNSNVTNVGGSGTTITSQTGTDGNGDAVKVNRLEGLSDDSYTIIGMYEKGDWSARMAYSWRSEYMVTAIDCCVAYPIWNEPYGQVDGSLTWNMTDSMQFTLQVSNLLNEETILRQQVENAVDGGLTMPNAWFQNDRRFTLGFRYRR